ncbi:Protein dennd6a [Blomia tropicalis]|nr:Protein dennd6a [Blomia tropicalis]
MDAHYDHDIICKLSLAKSVHVQIVTYITSPNLFNYKRLYRQFKIFEVEIILGVMNRFFVKTLADWPHLIKINDNVQGFTLKKTNLNGKSLDIKTGVLLELASFQCHLIDGVEAYKSFSFCY